MCGLGTENFVYRKLSLDRSQRGNMAFRVLVVKGGSQPGHRPQAQWHFM